MKLTQAEAARLMFAHAKAVRAANEESTMIVLNMDCAKQIAASHDAEIAFAELVAEYTDSEGL
jgi:putative IMPACT (imprinted ancient) family translation regulator